MEDAGNAGTQPSQAEQHARVPLVTSETTHSYTYRLPLTCGRLPGGRRQARTTGHRETRRAGAAPGNLWRGAKPNSPPYPTTSTL